MPGAERHFALAADFIRASNQLLHVDHCRPLSILSYYAAVHLFEALFDHGEHEHDNWGSCPTS